jgi:hypothetical protein
MAEKKVAYKIVVFENGKTEYVNAEDKKLRPTKDLERIPKLKMNEIQAHIMSYSSPCKNGWRWIFSPITGRWYRVRC